MKLFSNMQPLFNDKNFAKSPEMFTFHCFNSIYLVILLVNYAMYLVENVTMNSNQNNYIQLYCNIIPITYED